MMRKLTFVVLMLISISIAPSLPAQSPLGCSACGLIERALEDLGRLKTGMTRRDAEQYFALDGGMNFRGQTRYVYKKCDLVQLAITFEEDSSVQNDFSQKDKITKLSKLFLEFPSKD
jgi:hypothetical protein